MLRETRKVKNWLLNYFLQIKTLQVSWLQLTLCVNEA